MNSLENFAKSLDDNGSWQNERRELLWQLVPRQPLERRAEAIAKIAEFTFRSEAAKVTIGADPQMVEAIATCARTTTFEEVIIRMNALGALWSLASLSANKEPLWRSARVREALLESAVACPTPEPVIPQARKSEARKRTTAPFLSEGYVALAQAKHEERRKRAERAEVIFRSADKDGSGEVTVGELRALIQRDASIATFLNIPTDNAREMKRALATLVESTDADGDRSLDLKEFTELSHTRHEEAKSLGRDGRSREIQARTIFDFCDTDGSNTIDRHELYALIKKDETVARFLKFPAHDDDKLKKAILNFFRMADVAGTAGGIPDLTWQQFNQIQAAYAAERRGRGDESSEEEDKPTPKKDDKPKMRTRATSISGIEDPSQRPKEVEIQTEVPYPDEAEPKAKAKAKGKAKAKAKGKEKAKAKGKGAKAKARPSTEEPKVVFPDDLPEFQGLSPRSEVYLQYLKDFYTARFKSGVILRNEMREVLSQEKMVAVMPAEDLQKPKDEEFTVGERVQRRNKDEEWGWGYVKLTSPLKVTVNDTPDERGKFWDEVRKEWHPYELKHCDLRLMDSLDEKFPLSSAEFAAPLALPSEELTDVELVDAEDLKECEEKAQKILDAGDTNKNGDVSRTEMLQGMDFYGNEFKDFQAWIRQIDNWKAYDKDGSFDKKALVAALRGFRELERKKAIENAKKEADKIYKKELEERQKKEAEFAKVSVVDFVKFLIGEHRDEVFFHQQKIQALRFQSDGVSDAGSEEEKEDKEDQDAFVVNEDAQTLIDRRWNTLRKYLDENLCNHLQRQIKVGMLLAGGAKAVKELLKEEADEDGDIDAPRLGEVIRSTLKVPPHMVKPDELSKLFSALDDDGLGMVNVEEFIIFVEKGNVGLLGAWKKSRRKQMVEAPDRYITDRSGQRRKLRPGECTQCGDAVTIGTKFCSKCVEEKKNAASPQPAPMCSSCGTAFVGEAMFCHNCGTKRPSRRSSSLGANNAAKSTMLNSGNSIAHGNRKSRQDRASMTMKHAWASQTTSMPSPSNASRNSSGGAGRPRSLSNVQRRASGQNQSKEHANKILGKLDILDGPSDAWDLSVMIEQADVMWSKCRLSALGALKCLTTATALHVPMWSHDRTREVILAGSEDVHQLEVCARSIAAMKNLSVAPSLKELIWLDVRARFAIFSVLEIRDKPDAVTEVVQPESLADARRQAVGVMYNLSAADRNLLSMWKDGRFQRWILDFLKDHGWADSSLWAKGIRIMKNFCNFPATKGPIWNDLRFRKEILVGAMAMGPGDEDVRIKSIGALWNLSSVVDNQTPMWNDEQTRDALLAGIEASHPEIRIKSLGTLQNLAVSPENEVPMWAETRLREQLIQIFRSRQISEAKKKTSEILVNLSAAKANQEIIWRDSRLREALLFSAQPTATEQERSEDIRDKSLAIILSCSHASSNRVSMWHDDALRHVLLNTIVDLRAIVDPAPIERFRCKAIGVLWSLAEANANQESMWHSPVPDVLFSVLQRSDKDRQRFQQVSNEFQQTEVFVLGTMRCLASTDSNREGIWDNTNWRQAILQNALPQEGTTLRLRENSLGVLRQLSSSDLLKDEMWRDPGVRQVMTLGMESLHPVELRVCINAVATFRHLASYAAQRGMYVWREIRLWEALTQAALVSSDARRLDPAHGERAIIENKELRDEAFLAIADVCSAPAVRSQAWRDQCIPEKIMPLIPHQLMRELERVAAPFVENEKMLSVVGTPGSTTRPTFRPAGRHIWGENELARSQGHVTPSPKLFTASPKRRAKAPTPIREWEARYLYMTEEEIEEELAEERQEHSFYSIEVVIQGLEGYFESPSARPDEQSPTASPDAAKDSSVPSQQAKSLPVASCDIEIQGGASNGTRSTRAVNGIFPNKPALWSHGLVLKSFAAPQVIVFTLSSDPVTEGKSPIIGKARLRGDAVLPDGGNCALEVRRNDKDVPLEGIRLKVWICVLKSVQPEQVRPKIEPLSMEKKEVIISHIDKFVEDASVG